MALLRYNPLGWLHEAGLRQIESAYTVAEESLREEIARLREEAFAYQQGRELGIIPWNGERADDGSVLWSEEDFYEASVENARASLETFRKSFIPVIYHHWERGARKWITQHASYNPKKYLNTHDELVESVKRLGIGIHPELKILLALTNALKHNNAKYGRILKDHAPEYLLERYDPARTLDLFDCIHITNGTIEFFINVVETSGPDSKTIFVTE